MSSPSSISATMGKMAETASSEWQMANREASLFATRYSLLLPTRDSRIRRPTAASTRSRPAIRNRPDNLLLVQLSVKPPTKPYAGGDGEQAGRHHNPDVARGSHQQQPRHRLGRIADREEHARRSRIDFLAEAERQQIHRKRRPAGMRDHGGNARGETGSDRLWRRTWLNLHLGACGKP